MTAWSDPAVVVETNGAVATIWMNRPERLNAWSRDLSTGLLDALAQVAADPEIRGVVWTGRGRAFSAGADIKNPDTHRTNDLEAALDESITRGPNAFDVLSSFPKPIIAAVNGYSIGVGCLTPLCCDFIYAAESAKFQLPQVQLGVMPAYGGGLRLARLVGAQNAAEMILSGRMVTAREEAAKGMVARVFPDADLVPAAQEMMRTIAGHPPVAVKMARESLRTGVESGDMHAIELADAHRLLLLMTRRDTANQHQAWRERRDPSAPSAPVR